MGLCGALGGVVTGLKYHTCQKPDGKDRGAGEANLRVTGGKRI